MCVVVIGLVIGFFEGVSPALDPTVALQTWAAGNFAAMLAVAVLFYAAATRELAQSFRQAFATLGLYTLISIACGLVLSAWVVSPLVMVLIDWLAVVLGALVGTAIGVKMRMVKVRQRTMSASGR